MPSVDSQGKASEQPLKILGCPSPVSGQVCYVYESITTPIELIFLETPAIQAKPDLVQQCQEALDRIHAEGSLIGKVRPCIVTSPAPDQNRPAKICLQGTFGGVDPASLGDIYRQFVLPIYPNLGPPGTPHLHLVPEGREKNSWVVAFEFESPRPLSNAWFPKDATISGASRASSRKPNFLRGGRPRVSRKLEKVSNAVLRDRCSKSFREWQTSCLERPERAEECLKQHRVSTCCISNTSASHIKSHCVRIDEDLQAFPVEPPCALLHTPSAPMHPLVCQSRWRLCLRRAIREE